MNIPVPLRHWALHNVELTDTSQRHGKGASLDHLECSRRPWATATERVTAQLNCGVVFRELDHGAVMSSLANDTGTDRAPEPSHNVVTPGELTTQMRGN